MHALNSQKGKSQQEPARLDDDCDGAAQVRLSILCAYLFGKSALFAALLRWAGHAGALLRAAAQPLALVLGFAPLTLHPTGSCLCLIFSCAGRATWRAPARSRCRSCLGL